MSISAEECVSKLFVRADFSSPNDCIGLLISKALGLAILAGSVLLKLPQILSIYSSKDVEGLVASSFYTEVPLVTTNIVYNYLQGNPFSSYGENVFILVQNLILVFLLWTYMKPESKPSIPARAGILLSFVGVAVASANLPADFRSVLPLTNLPLVIASRVPQIIQNFRKSSTGSLSFITTFLIFAGSLARVFTTIQEVGLDPSLLLNFAVGLLTSGALLLQILFYGNKQAAGDEKKKK